MKALLLAALLAQVADPTPPPEKPSVVKLADDAGYFVSQVAWSAIDAELSRLQGVERLHKQENWLGAVLVSSGVGALLGAGLASLIWYFSTRP